MKLLELMNPKDWTAENAIDVPYARAHGLAWDGDGLWAAFTTDKIIAKYDVKTGRQMDEVKLPESSPDPHGLTNWRGSLLYSDAVTGEVGRVIR